MKDFMKDVFWTIWWKKIQIPIFASLISWENLILFWETWANKTWFVESFSKVMDVSYRIYTVPTIELEEITPFKKNEEGIIEPIKTLTSVWDSELVFLDELNRVWPEKQGLFFEILRGKSIKWIPLKKLKWVMSAVNLNLNEYKGTYVFDPATADRFAFVVSIPSFHTFNEQEIYSVWTIKSEFENRPLSYFLEDYKPKITIQNIKEEDKLLLKKFLKDCSFVYSVLYNEDSEIEDLFLQTLVKMLEEVKDKKIGEILETNQIWWRKFNTYKKTFLSWFSVWKELYYNYSWKNFLKFSDFWTTFKDLLKWSNTQILIGNLQFEKTLLSSWETAFKECLEDYIYTEVKTKNNLLIEIFKLPKKIDILNKDSVLEIVTKVFNSNSSDIDYNYIQLLNIRFLQNQLKSNSLIKSFFNNRMEELWNYKEGILGEFVEKSSQGDALDQLALANYYFYLKSQENDKNWYNYNILKSYNNYVNYFKSKLNYIKKGLS